MNKKDTIEAFIERTADAARLVKANHITLMMQAVDTDPLSFSSVVRIDDMNPFSNDGGHISKITQASALMRSRESAHKEAERLVHMQDLNRNPDFVNAYLKVFADGRAVLHAHCGIGPSTRILKKELSGSQITDFAFSA